MKLIPTIALQMPFTLAHFHEIRLEDPSNIKAKLVDCDSMVQNHLLKLVLK